VGKRLIQPIPGRRLRLRLLERADLPLTLAWRNQPEIRRWFVHAAPLTPDGHAQWFERYRQDDADFVFVIEETERFHRPVGQVALYRIDWARRTAEYGRLLIGEPEAVGRGLAREATELLLTYAFDVLDLERIELHVFPDNAPARAIYRRCGFVEAGEQDGLLRMTPTRRRHRGARPAGAGDGTSAVAWAITRSQRARKVSSSASRSVRISRNSPSRVGPASRSHGWGVGRLTRRRRPAAVALGPVAPARVRGRRARL
jgi:RimJ/RimL family protein N-acetyltransferase